MSSSRRAKRMARLHKRGGGAKLNMVSLMDIFTILVFFLLVNSSNQQMEDKTIELPTARVDEMVRETLVVSVNDQAVVVQGRKVADVKELLAQKEEGLIEGLQKELKYQYERDRMENAEEEREITILGDKAIPYKLLKRIMLTCSETHFSRISLAVSKQTVKAKKKGAG